MLRLVNPSTGASTLILDDNLLTSLNILIFNDNSPYTHDVINVSQGANGFTRRNPDGTVYGTATSQVLFSPPVGIIRGIAYVDQDADGFMAIILSQGISIQPRLGNPVGSIQDYLAPVYQPDPKSADFDLDGDVDFVDWAVFQECFEDISGSSGGVPCEAADLNWDEAVTLDDHVQFASQTTGPQ